MNSFGRLYRLTTFGESHGAVIGGVIDGMPPCVRIDRDAIRTAMQRRRPGSSQLVSARNEADEVEFLSGLKDDVTLGTPIAFVIRNNDARSNDYSALEHSFRPNHADYTYFKKYGIRDARGGGRASARETACRVVAGALAAQVLAQRGIEIRAYVSGIGKYLLEEPYIFPDYEDIYSSAVRCPDKHLATLMTQLVEDCRSNGDSIGARVSCVIRGVPCGIGSPIYDKLQSALAAAMMSINAAKGFEYGIGFKAIESYGSEVIDSYVCEKGDNGLTLRTVSNHSGGIHGGISNGSDITLSVAFKPTPTLLRDMASYTDEGEATVIPAKGRHDPCVGIRAVPVVEAMASITILDALLQYHRPGEFSNLD
jgi:chorismate synthase